MVRRNPNHTLHKGNKMKANILHGLIDQLNGATFLGLDIETVPTVNKTRIGLGGVRESNPHYGRIRKVVMGMSVMVSTSKSGSPYERMVRRRQAAEGKEVDFTAEKRAWGTRIGTTPMIEHKDQIYLEIFCQHPGVTTYYLDDTPINEEDIIGLRIATHNEEAQGGIDDQVIIRAVNAESIIGMRIDGVAITVTR